GLNRPVAHQVLQNDGSDQRSPPSAEASAQIVGTRERLGAGNGVGVDHHAGGFAYGGDGPADCPGVTSWPSVSNRVEHRASSFLDRSLSKVLHKVGGEGEEPIFLSFFEAAAD